jgi:structural maintenance of chromosome 1
MDAISFVLGVRSAQLRSQQLADLIYRPPGENDPRPTKASVRAIYMTSEGDEIHFTRRITAAGGSDYLINERVVTFNQYTKTLQKENILVKARNFLVFQGDVESVASQAPKDLTRLIEQISGSLELKEDYERAKDEMNRTNDELTEKFHKKKGLPPTFLPISLSL